MNLDINRRHFIKTSAIAGVACATGLKLSAFAATEAPLPLYSTSWMLVQTWAEALLKMQITDKRRVDDFGGIWCPADKAVHGRVGDAIYPFFYMAAQTKDSRYTDAAMLLYRWIERRVSQPDGSWLNEPVKGSWKGTTVFMAIALGEALKHHSELMGPAFKAELMARLKKAGDFIYDTFNINFGNINYPISGAYGLALLGEVLNEPKFIAKGPRTGAPGVGVHHTKRWVFKRRGRPILRGQQKRLLLCGSGVQCRGIAARALVQYGLLTKDEEVLQGRNPFAANAHGTDAARWRLG
jgi:hypothetical protein